MTDAELLEEARATIRTLAAAWEMMLPCIKNNAIQDYALVLTDAPLAAKGTLRRLDERLGADPTPTEETDR